MTADCEPTRKLPTLDEVMPQLRELALAQPLPALERVLLREACGRVLSQSVIADVRVPPADNSAMDGYAVRSTDVVSGREMSVSQRIPAGQSPELLLPGTCARVFTGAEMPDGADAVVMQESVEVLADGSVRLPAVSAGENVRRAGQDIERGDQVMAAGRRLTAADVGVLASVGICEVEVFRRVRVAVLSSGDELVSPGEPLLPGQLYNSNQHTMVSLLGQAGFEVHDAGTLPDDLVATRVRLVALAESADVILTSGGVSVGEEDHLKAAVEAEGRLVHWKLGIKPGKPVAFGEVAGTPFIGLPGNPVAVWVTLLVVALPWLRWRQGEAYELPVPFMVPSGFRRKAGGRREYLRVRRVMRSGGMRLEAFPNQSSGVLSSVSWAEGLAWQEVGQAVEEGDLLPYLSFADWLA